MSMRSVLFAAGVLCVSVLLPLAAAEQSAPDPDKAVDEGLNRFGYLAGLARGCVANGQQTDLEREAVDLHAGIARLLGTDRAFLFAASFGHGTSVAVEIADCQDVLSRYEARVASFRAKQGAR